MTLLDRLLDRLFGLVLKLQQRQRARQFARIDAKLANMSAQNKKAIAQLDAMKARKRGEGLNG